MIKPALLISLILIANFSFAQKRPAGKYQTNFPSYGMFSETLTLNCDSTAVIHFVGDLMNDYSYGKWKVIKDTVILTFDSSNKRYKGTLHLGVRNNKLYKGINKVQYAEFQSKVNEHNAVTGDSLQLPAIKDLNLTIKNSSGDRGVQFYKRIKKHRCRTTAANKGLSAMLASEHILVDISLISCSPSCTNITELWNIPSAFYL